MLPVLRLGTLAIQTRGLIVILGVWLAVLVAERCARKDGLSPDPMVRGLTIGLMIGLVGARVLYVLQHFSEYAAHPGDMLSLSLTAFDGWGGFFVGAVGALVYARRRSIAVLPSLDALAPGAAVLGAALAIADLASGDAFGAPSSLPWAIRLWGASRHPTQLYQFVGYLILLVVLLHWKPFRPGQRFAFAAAMAAGLVGIVEAFRGDSFLALGGVRSVQVAALAVALLSMWAFGVLARIPVSQDDRSPDGGHSAPNVEGVPPSPTLGADPASGPSP